MDVTALSDADIISRLKALAQQERVSMKIFIVLLREFDRRRLAGPTQHGTTFVYCTNELKLSEGETFRRLQVASVIDRHGRLLDMIEDGRLTLTTASLLAPFLNHSNFADLTSRSAGQGRRQVEAIVAEYKQRPEARDVVAWLTRAKKAQAPDSPSPSLDLTAEPPKPPPQQADAAQESLAPPAASEPAASAIDARLHFDVSKPVFEKFQKARGLLRHKHPEGRWSDILDEALDALLDRIDRSRKDTPASKRPVLPGRRYIPEWVKDEVWRRDGGRCAFHTVDGKRCEASEWLEYDHMRPFAMGGRSDDPDNVRLLCRAHNQHRAREDFGDPAWTGGTFEAGGDTGAPEPELPFGGEGPGGGRR